MLSTTPALGFLCLLLASSASSAPAAPVAQMAERSTEFNPKQKWQVDEVNCIQILNPAPGATYHPEIQAGGKIRYDYHEVIADGINERRTQYTWSIPADQDLRARNVHKVSDYYVRVETSSSDGVKLVGNAGPFAIYPELQRRDNAAKSDSTEFDAKFALPHRPTAPAPAKPVASTTPKVTTTEVSVEAPVVASTTPKATTPKVSVDNPVVVPITPKTPVETPIVPIAPVDTPAQPNIPDGSAATLKPAEQHPLDSAGVSNVNVPATPAPGVVVPATPAPADPVTMPILGDSSAVSTPSDSSVGDVPVPHNLPPVHDTGKGEPVTPIQPSSIIPSKAIMVAGVTAGALVIGYGGGALFGALGSAVGAIVGGVVGGLAVLASFAGIPV
ncbi:hypothetical protein BG000_004478 [Podila horticola]|nr:hypothetical protein BG000_004478 [Podila horticola]